MILPAHVLECIQLLESNGYEAYAVGGCVRDALLGLQAQDYDLCTDAAPQQIKAVFSHYRLVLSGEKHGTVAVITSGGLVEITTYRTEGGYQDNRHPDWVRFVTDIREDLSRRDFTINAMAFSPKRGLTDPWGGRHDLDTGVLRAVGDPSVRFSEDALRILRGMRFAARYHLQVEPQTQQAMLDQAYLLPHLAAERVFSELCKLIVLVDAQDLLQYAPVFAKIIPELQPTMGFDQRNPHHAYDVYTHTAYVTAAVPGILSLRLAALLHDIGKVPTFTLDDAGCGHFLGHAKASAQMAQTILLRLKAPTALREQVVNLIARHMTIPEPDKRLLRRRLGQYGVEETNLLLQLQQADFRSKGTVADDPVFDAIARLLDQIIQEDACLRIHDLAINGHDLIALGFTPGKQIGRCLSYLLQQVQDELLCNSKEPLLQEARHFLQTQQEDIP